MKIFTIYDSKATAYLTPFFSKSEATATRECKSVVNNPEHQFNTYAEDYSLFVIGEFDEDTGKINSQNPVHVVNLIALRDDNNIIPITGGPQDDGDI